MKRIIFLALLVCFNNSLPAMADAPNQRNAPETGKQVETTSGTGQEEGVVKTYYPDGALWEEFTNKNGRRQGKYREYDPKGMLKKEIDFENGEIKEIRNYDENRQLIIRILKENVAEENENTEKSYLAALHNCVSEEAGIKFACNPNWKLSRAGRTLTIMVSLIPQVEIVIEETNLKLKTIGAFNRDAVSSLDRFEEGFEIQRVGRCGRETVNVNGFLKGDPYAKVTDFFMLDHGVLHSVQFSVKPGDAWLEYQDLINKVVESLEFTQQQPGVKFSLDPTDENCEELVE